MENEVKVLEGLIFDENCDGSLDNIVDYSKDAFGNILSASLDFDGDGVADSKVYFEYDDQGRMVQKSMDKNSDGKIDSVAYYKYDEAGNVSVHYDDNADGKVDYVETTDADGKTVIKDIRDKKQKIMETIKNVFFSKY